MDVRERDFFFQTLLIYKCVHGLAPEYLTNNVGLIMEENDINDLDTRRHHMNFTPACTRLNNVCYVSFSRTTQRGETQMDEVQLESHPLNPSGCHFSWQAVTSPQLTQWIFPFATILSTSVSIPVQ